MLDGSTMEAVVCVCECWGMRVRATAAHVHIPRVVSLMPLLELVWRRPVKVDAVVTPVAGLRGGGQTGLCQSVMDMTSVEQARVTLA